MVSQPCQGVPNASAARAHDHDLMDMVKSGYLDELGFDFKHATAASTFREPSKVTQALV